MADDDARWRVKVYILNSELQWEEKGVGYVTCQHSARHKRMCIHVEEEGSDDLLLEAPILPISADEEVYKKQQDTLLVWEEPDGKDLALSFQVMT
jgi:protein phosphatase-4 regulatory subunit 3